MRSEIYPLYICCRGLGHARISSPPLEQTRNGIFLALLGGTFAAFNDQFTKDQTVVPASLLRRRNALGTNALPYSCAIPSAEVLGRCAVAMATRRALSHQQENQPIY